MSDKPQQLYNIDPALINAMQLDNDGIQLLVEEIRAMSEYDRQNFFAALDARILEQIYPFIPGPRFGPFD